MTYFLFLRKICVFVLFLIWLALQGVNGASLLDTKQICFSFFYESDQFIPVDFSHLDSFLRQHPDYTILSAQIESSCDDVGDDDYNRRLAIRRAKALSDSLANRYGISSKTFGKGELQLIGTDTLTERAANRQSKLCLVYEIPAPVSAPMVLKAGEKLTLRNLLFFPGHNDLRPGSKPTLDSLASALKQNPKLKIHIIGHVCCTPAGKDGLDMETGIENLSVARAQRVYDLLILSGIPANRLSFEGRGGNEPLGQGDNYDRRVEIEVRE